MRRVIRNRNVLVGAGLLIVLVLGAGLADVITVPNPTRLYPDRRLRPPSATNLLGTDEFGRDVWSLVVFGARVSLLVGVTTMLITSIGGGAIGLAAGYSRRLDPILMRVMDGLQAFPAILLAIALMAARGPGVANVIFALSVVYTPRTAMLIRSTVLTLRELDYVQAARALGQRDRWVLARHIMPNCVSALLVQASVNFANAMVIEAGLSFLGIGTPPPTASWGLMLNEARAFMTSARHVAIAPGVAISLAVLGWNLLGDGLRDALDPRLTD
jgi:peptide/nickel transport system permease protein